MKCEHCYHGKVCKGSGIEIVADECHHFVEATKMIELPCKVGDMVYGIARDKKHIQKFSVCSVCDEAMIQAEC